jgi:hypothetical protein
VTAAEAEDLGGRILAAIDASETYNGDPAEKDHLVADRERVASDLHVIHALGSMLTGIAAVDAALDIAHKAASDNLRRTAALYGVEAPNV